MCEYGSFFLDVKREAHYLPCEAEEKAQTPPLLEVVRTTLCVEPGPRGGGERENLNSETSVLLPVLLPVVSSFQTYRRRRRSCEAAAWTAA